MKRLLLFIPLAVVPMSATSAHADLPPLESEDGAFAAELEGRLQFRFEYLELDGEDEAALLIPRGRIGFSGHAFTEDIQYKFQADFGKGFVTLKDYYIDYQAAPDVWLRMGQYKRPFSRQQITSSGRQALVDRAITDKAFSSGRDLGVMLHNRYEKSPIFEYAVGIFNGTGDSPDFEGEVVVDPVTGEPVIEDGGFTNVPDRFAPMFVARVGYNTPDLKGYSEADLEGGPLRFGVAGSALAELDWDDDDESATRGELDYIVKARGFSSTGAVYAATAQNDDSFGDQAFDALGFHVQAGYVFGTWQPVVRYELVDPDAEDTYQQVVTAGLSLYRYGHNFKWQTDASAIETEVAGDATTDYRARTQVQLSW